MQRDDTVLVIGSEGQLGQELICVLKNLPKVQGTYLQGPIPCADVPLSNLDISKREDLIRVFSAVRPKYVINAAAYTDVDGAESNRDLAERINADAVREIASLCADYESKLIHFSTDYVFSGDKETAYCETDPPDPINFYGQTKLKGERYVAESQAPYLIIRTSWLYSNRSKNFFTTMMRLFQQKEVVQVVSDQFGCPTSTNSLANFCRDILIQDMGGAKIFQDKPGIYHYSNLGRISWYDFALEIYNRRLANGTSTKTKSVESIPSEKYVTAAKRPRNSTFCLHKIQKNLGSKPVDWKQELLAVSSS